MEVRSRNDVCCSACDFVGDAIELYAAVSKQPLASAVAQLILDGTLSFPKKEFGDAQVEYLADRATNRQLIDLWAAGTKWVKDGVGSAILGQLQDLHAFQNNLSPVRLAKVFGVYRRDDLDEMLDLVDNERQKSGSRLTRCVNKYAILGMPCWDGSKLVGLWLIHSKVFDVVGSCYLSLQDCQSSFGLGHLVRATDEAVFVTNDPRVSLRFMLRQLWYGDAKSPYLTFVCPGPKGDRRVLDAGVRDVIYLPCESNGQNQLEWLQLAMRSTGASTVMVWKMRDPPMVGYPQGTPKQMTAALRNLAVPAHQALGAYLLTRPLAEGAKHVSWLSLSSTDQNLVRSYFSGEDARTLERLFDTVDRPRSIDFNGKRITESKAGWRVGDAVICSAVIRISQSETDKVTGKTMLDGTISTDGKIARFHEDLAVIKKDQLKWVDGFVRRMQGWPVIDPRWGRHLIDIAYNFSQGVVRLVTSDRPFGWGADNVLRFPRFLVETTGVTQTNCAVNGPNVRPPEPISPNHFDALSDRDFCLVSLALIGNLLRTQAGMHSYGLLVPGAPHVVERLADALGLPMARDASVQEVMGGENRPLPLAGVWQDGKLAELLKVKGPKNIFTSIDSRSFQLLAAEPDWVRLPVSSLATYDEIRWVYHAIPRLMRSPPKTTEERFFSPIAAALHEWVYPHCQKHQLTQAAAELDSRCCTAGSAGAQGNHIVSLLRQLHDDGVLRAETVGDLVRIRHQDVLAAFASPILPPADLPRMTKTLADGKLLLGVDAGAWSLNETLWSLMGSYLKTKD